VRNLDDGQTDFTDSPLYINLLDKTIQIDFNISIIQPYEASS